MRFQDIERFMYKLLTVSGKAVFWCDSKPLLCIHCKRLRELIKFGRMSNLMLIFTKRGVYLWSSVKNLKVQKIG